MEKKKNSKRKKIFIGVTAGLATIAGILYLTSGSKKDKIDVSFKEDITNNNIYKKKYYNKKKYNGFKPHNKNNF